MTDGKMTTVRSFAERMLVLLLRASAVLLLTAALAAVMPFAWMDAIHGWLGLGRLPDQPIVGYLTRSLSLLYAMHGALLWYLSCDVRQWRPFIQFLALVSVVFGASLTVLDVAVGLPLPWILGEGPGVIVSGLLMLGLAARVRPTADATSKPELLTKEKVG
jgi:hypothetical protein